MAVSLTSPFDDSDQKRKRQHINDISLPKAVINCNSWEEVVYVTGVHGFTNNVLTNTNCKCSRQQNNQWTRSF